MSKQDIISDASMRKECCLVEWDNSHGNRLQSNGKNFGDCFVDDNATGYRPKMSDMIWIGGLGYKSNEGSIDTTKGNASFEKKIV